MNAGLGNNPPIPTLADLMVQIQQQQQLQLQAEQRITNLLNRLDASDVLVKQQQLEITQQKINLQPSRLQMRM